MNLRGWRSARQRHGLRLYSAALETREVQKKAAEYSRSPKPGGVVDGSGKASKDFMRYWDHKDRWVAYSATASWTAAVYCRLGNVRGPKGEGRRKRIQPQPKTWRSS